MRPTRRVSPAIFRGMPITPTKDLPPFSTGAFGRSKKRSRDNTIAQFCTVCGSRYYVRPADDGLYVSCSLTCDRAFPTPEKDKPRRPYLKHAGRLPLHIDVAEDPPPPAPATTVALPVSPRDIPDKLLSEDDINELRSTIAAHVREQIDLAHRFVMAAAPAARRSPAPAMNSQQVRVFTALLNKVVPDLTANSHAHRLPSKPVNEMTRAELESLVARASETLHDVRAAEARLAHSDDHD